ncbi:ABC transporter permease [Myceligenerans crystallogenes]|uniref:FtsX-like permease family protein n=1 Tax=Myceligenerans crystallogenes TaxID=316335 RepID=A0ABP4ZKL7_9MICO
MTTTATAPARTSPAAGATPPRNDLPTIRYTLAQMRRSAGRLTAAGIAILIGTAFVAVTLIAGNVITRTTYDTVAARYADADVVVKTGADSWQQDVEAVRAVDGVMAAQPVLTGYLDLSAGGGRSYGEAFALPDDERLSPLRITDGAWPAARGEIAVPEQIAERLEIGVGDTVTVHGWEVTDPETGEGEETTEEVTVSGITEDLFKAYAASGGAVVAMPQDMVKWSDPPEVGEVFEVMAVLDPSVMSDGEPTAAIREALAAAVVSDGRPEVLSVDEHAAEISAEQTGGEDLVFLVFVLTFAAVALVVAGLVIANTFQVLVAQRTRTLALLRCIGAGRGQLYRSVLFEAFVLGALASLGGVVTGALLAQIALWVAPRFDLGVPLPSVVEPTPQVVLLPLAVGVVVTILAALAPAMNATRVAPLAALRPAAAPSLRQGAGRVRAVFALLFTLGGAGLLALAVLVLHDDPEYGLLVAVAGGALSLVGVIVGAVFWLPKVAAFFGRLTGASGPAAKLAAANTLRNPRRTSATATALLIGVTLIVTMATGAAAARATATTALDLQFPMDVMVGAGATDVPGDTASRVADAASVDAVAEIRTADGTFSDNGYVTLSAAAPDALRGAVRDAGEVDAIQPGSILFSPTALKEWGVEAGERIEVKGPGGKLPLTIVVTESEAFTGFVTEADLAKVAPEAELTQVWASLADDADPASGLAEVQEALNDDGLMVLGLAAQRAQFEQVINLMLGIVVGLLAVAVVIAVIGVTNTLSLSVIERRRESATLRAIGLSKSQLRGMLAVEGMLIAGVGAVLGIVLGLVYGWAGAATALSVMGEVTYPVPWVDLAVVLAVSLVAGLIASVAPARNALRASPVEALAAE